MKPCHRANVYRGSKQNKKKGEKKENRKAPPFLSLSFSIPTYHSTYMSFTVCLTFPLIAASILVSLSLFHSLFSLPSHSLSFVRQMLNHGNPSARKLRNIIVSNFLFCDIYSVFPLELKKQFPGNPPKILDFIFCDLTTIFLHEFFLEIV